MRPVACALCCLLWLACRPEGPHRKPILTQEWVHTLNGVFAPDTREARAGCNGVTSLEGLDKLQELRSLDIGDNPIGSLEGIQQATKLEILDASNTNVRDLSPLGSLKGLKQLNIMYSRVESLDGLPESLKVLIVEPEFDRARLTALRKVRPALEVQHHDNLKRLSVKPGPTNVLCLAAKH